MAVAPYAMGHLFRDYPHEVPKDDRLVIRAKVAGRDLVVGERR